MDSMHDTTVGQRSCRGYLTVVLASCLVLAATAVATYASTDPAHEHALGAPAAVQGGAPNSTSAWNTLRRSAAAASSSSLEGGTGRGLQTIPTYYPGKLTVSQNGLLLSQGLQSRLIAKAGSRVTYANGKKSKVAAHSLPDYGACFQDTRSTNPGGWIYTSNSEGRSYGKGGVGAYTFNKDGKLIDYKRILQKSTANCGGGTTPWGAYVSCEETSGGHCFQLDPTGVLTPQIITMGTETNGGYFESFTSNDKDPTAPEFYTTEDSSYGVIRRFKPASPDWTQPWKMLLGNGVTEYLYVDASSGTFTWTSDLSAARANAHTHFPYTEGINFYQDNLYFITKVFKSMYILDLEAGTYTNVTTKDGAFDGQPDQVITNVAPSTSEYQDNKWLFFTEDSGRDAGLFARNVNGDFYTILESTSYSGDESTGLSFSPDGKHLYFALQGSGLTFDITRVDGLAFQDEVAGIEYHAR